MTTKATTDISVASEVAGSRMLLDVITSKWSLLVLAELCRGPLRFNELRRSIDGVTQKALTQCLRRLERSAIVSRQVQPTSPVSVIYDITPMGRSLEVPLRALLAWSVSNAPPPAI